MSKIELTAEEARELVFEGQEVERIVNEKVRWGNCVESVVKIKDKYYMINWLEGATEMQEDEFGDQDAFEVERYKVVVEKWRVKK